VARILILHIVAFLALQTSSSAQPRKSVIDGDGELLLCMQVTEFLQGFGRAYAPTPSQRFPEFAGAIIYSRADFWRGAEYLVRTVKAAVFVRDRLVAILTESEGIRSVTRTYQVYNDLKKQLTSMFEVPGQEGYRIVVLGPVFRWFTLTDEKGNRIILELEGRSFPTEGFIRVKYLASGFPPAPSIPLEWAIFCGLQSATPTRQDRP
jgi:hypothetical protein